jgi:hypothetical protein
MKEKEANFKSSIKFVFEAFQFLMEQENKSRYFNDRLPMWGPETAKFIIENLKPEAFRDVIAVYSSFNYGKYILDTIFPRYENPEDYHSRDGVVRLDEHPIQVLGWDDYDQMVQEGLKNGLIEDWIDRGLEHQARERGIDPEWHFFADP